MSLRLKDGSVTVHAANSSRAAVSSLQQEFTPRLCFILPQLPVPSLQAQPVFGAYARLVLWHACGHLLGRRVEFPQGDQQGSL